MSEEIIENSSNSSSSSSTSGSIFPICNRCKLPIEDTALIYIQPALLLQHFFAQVPPIFHCPEHAENFAQKLVFQSDCWMDELRDHGALIHNMTEVRKRYAKEALEKIVAEPNTPLISENKEGI